jgi:hypothetical protein
MATPYGRNVAAIQGVVAQYHTVMRVSGTAKRYPLGRDVPTSKGYGIGFTYLANNIPLATTIAEVDQLIAQGGVRDFLSHHIDAGTDDVNVTSANYRTFCQYIAQKRDAGLLDVLTYSEFFDRNAVIYTDGMRMMRSTLLPDGTVTATRIN